MRTSIIIASTLVAGCAQLGNWIGTGPAQVACEPATGATYTVRMRGDVGGVERGTPDTRCGTVAAAQEKIEQRRLCLLPGGDSLLVAWAPESGLGGAVRIKGQFVFPECQRFR